jgi:hypothetical protein
MTIVAGVACPEGLVVAGDTRSSIQLPGGSAAEPGAPRILRTATDHSRKVFSIDDRFVAATFGWAILEGKTISGHAAEFDEQITIEGDVTVAATELRDYFRERLRAHFEAGWDEEPAEGAEPLGFIVAGYDGDGRGHLMRVWPRGGEIADVATTTEPGGIWNGEVDVMIRLLKGYDLARIDISDWPEDQQTALAQVEYVTPFGWFALQDAVDWTTFVARTTIDTQRFTNGTIQTPGAVPTCGGAVDVATVTWGDNVRWVQRTEIRA